MNPSEASQTIEYRIDAHGALNYLSDSWTRFALENGSPDLVSQRVIGQSLLKFISDRETRHLYELILERVRSTEAVIVVTLRCDSPSFRRFLQLMVSPLPCQEIRFLSRTLRTERRAPVRLLDPSTNRAGELLTMCSWCKRILLPADRWAEVEDALTELELFHRVALPKLTHGICPACFAKVTEELRP